MGFATLYECLTYQTSFALLINSYNYVTLPLPYYVQSGLISATWTPQLTVGIISENIHYCLCVLKAILI